MAGQDTTDYFKALYEVSADPTVSLAAKVEQALTIGRDRLAVDYGVLSYTGDGDYEVIDSTIESGQYTAGSTHDLGKTWCRHVVDGQEMLVVSDAGDSPYSDDVAREVTGLQYYLGAPIRVDGDVYGTLCFSGDEPRTDPFRESDQQFVELLTQWIGYEIERERHYQTLDAQNERLNEFAGVLAHDLRNPLTAARGYTELVAENVDDPHAEHLETALSSLDRIEALVTETLSLAREGKDVGEREPVRLSAVSRAAWETVDPDAGELEIVDDRTVNADESRLRQLFENLFRNVDEHCGPETTVTVEGTDEGFAVADDGPGLPEAVTESLFEERRYGTERRGLGLLIVERVVSGHGWSGSVTTDESGTRFDVTDVGVVSDPPRLDDG